MLKVLNQDAIPLKICLFIDGLDEFEGPQDLLIDLVKSLPQKANVKLCISSCPLTVLEQAFRGNPGIKLQELTKNSIRAFVNGLLLEHPRIQQLNPFDRERANILAGDVARRAEGVFLWAAIVVRDLREGVQNEDTLKELEQQVLILPSEIEGVYAAIINKRIKPA